LPHCHLAAAGIKKDASIELRGKMIVSRVWRRGVGGYTLLSQQD
jgi:hypothetical protein